MPSSFPVRIVAKFIYTDFFTFEFDVKDLNFLEGLNTIELDSIFET